MSPPNTVALSETAKKLSPLGKELRPLGVCALSEAVTGWPGYFLFGHDADG